MLQIFEKRNLFFDLEDYQNTYNVFNPYKPNELYQYQNSYYSPIEVKNLLQNSTYVYYIEPNSQTIKRAKCKLIINELSQTFYFETPLFEKKYLILFYSYLTFTEDERGNNFTEMIALNSYRNGTPFNLSLDIFNNSQEVRRLILINFHVITNQGLLPINEILFPQIIE